MYIDKTPKRPTPGPSTSSASSLLTMPLQQKTTAINKRKAIGQYFVISSDAAYMEKRKAKDEKEQKQKQIEERKLKRLKIKEEKENVKKAKKENKCTKK